ncbi:hypothetical protein [Sphingobacterium faecale]|uniref:DUF4374 domain-containing protein n=1 Tax=Sphingobacterium faecale TaxID=2803775 RepID=A0ABS1R688_9SPHI|nr:hypothetical protein [Sphingobacterium faecale]MBL1410226.1 hypothetical protein [Sphingobacterium faecale]
MKRFILNAILLLLLGMASVGCSNEGVEPEQPADACVLNNLVMLRVAFDGSYQASVAYNKFAVNGLNPSSGSLLGTVATNHRLTFQLPTNSSFYDKATGTHGMLISRAEAYLKFDVNTGVGQAYAVQTNFAAPVLNNGNAYVIAVDQSYASSGVGEHYMINSFNMQNGTTGAALPISIADRTFDNHSFFANESMSSTSNGVDKLYFLSGTNLITVNTATNTASHRDLYPSFSQANDWVAFYGVKYSQSLGLIALKRDASGFSLVKINPNTGTHTTLLAINAAINTEFYSAAYRECDKTYYLTSMNQSNPTVETGYYEFDLNSNTLVNTQVLTDYGFGIEIIQ